MELALKSYTLKLKHTFGISRESYDTQESLIVILSLGGKTGYGEATSNPYYGITVPGMMAEIEGIRSDIEDFNLKEPTEFHQFLVDKGLSNFSICALDLAAHDLYGKMLDKPLYEIWGTAISHYPVSNYTIGLDKTEVMVAKIKEKPWPIYKIKLGTDHDLDIVRELRRHTDARFRIDALPCWGCACVWKRIAHWTREPCCRAPTQA